MDKGCVSLIMWLVAAPLIYLVRGYVLSALWEWFVVPLGAPLLSVPLAMGLSLIVGFLTTQARSEKEELGDDWLAHTVGAILGVIVQPFLILGIGALARTLL